MSAYRNAYTVFAWTRFYMTHPNRPNRSAPIYRHPIPEKNGTTLNIRADLIFFVFMRKDIAIDHAPDTNIKIPYIVYMSMLYSPCVFTFKSFRDYDMIYTIHFINFMIVFTFFSDI